MAYIHTGPLVKPQNLRFESPADHAYSLPSLWADRDNHGDLINPGMLPLLADPLTNLFIDLYRPYYPWNWLQSQFGIGEEQGFFKLLGATPSVSVLAIIVFIIGLITFGVQLYVQFIQKKKVMLEIDLEDHKRHWKIITANSLIAAVFLSVVASCVLYDSLSLLITSAVPTVVMVLTKALQDMKLFRKNFVLDSNYFFDVYFADNFVYRADIESQIAEVVQQLPFNKYEALNQDLVSQVTGHSQQISALHQTVYSNLVQMAELLQQYKGAVDSLDMKLSSLTAQCIQKGFTFCNAGDFPVHESKQTTLLNITNTLTEFETKFNKVNLADIAGLVATLRDKIAGELSSGPLGLAVKDIARSYVTAGYALKNSYELDKGFPLTNDFAEEPLDYWDGWLKKHDRSWYFLYVVFLVFAALVSGYCLVNIICLIMGELGTRGSKFPCPRRSKTSTKAASAMALANSILLFILLFISTSSSLFITAGSVAMHLSDALYTQELFDYVIDETPRLNHSFVIAGTKYQIHSYRKALHECEVNKTGMLYAVGVRPPVFSHDISKHLPDINSAAIHFKELTDYYSFRPVVHTTWTVWGDYVKLKPLNSQGFQLLLAATLSNNSEIAATQATQEADTNKKSDLESMSALYKSLYEDLSTLTTEFSSTHYNLLLANTDLLHLVEHYTEAQDKLNQLYTDTEELKIEFGQYSSHAEDLTPVYQHIVDTADTHVTTSNDILVAKAGNCAILAEIYAIVTEFFYFSVVRYVNLVWMSSLLLFLALVGAGIANHHMTKYYKAYKDISYATTAEILRTRSNASAIQLDVCDADKKGMNSEESLEPEAAKVSNTLMVSTAHSRARSVMHNGRAASKISAFSSQDSLVPKHLLSRQQISEMAVPIKLGDGTLPTDTLIVPESGAKSPQDLNKEGNDSESDDSNSDKTDETDLPSKSPNENANNQTEGVKKPSADLSSYKMLIDSNAYRQSRKSLDGHSNSNKSLHK